MKKRICILRSNPVNPDSRVEKEAWSLAKSGHDITIFAWDRDGNHPKSQESIMVADQRISIVRVGYQAGYGQGWKSLLPFIRFQLSIVFWLLQNHRKFDVIHACDFDTAMLSFFFKGKTRFVFDIFDFLFGEPVSAFQLLIKKWQLMLINHADATIICTEERKKQIAGSSPQKLVVIHNTPFEGLRSARSGLIFRGHANKVKLSYVGIYADERLLLPICRVIARHPELELHIGGFGELEQEIIAMANSYDNIICYGRIPYSHTLELESMCDIMLAIYNPADENCRFAAPNKFYESLMLGKPVIMAKGTGMSNVIELNDTGVLIDFSEDGFEQGVLELISRRSEWQTMGSKMKKLYSTDYNWQTMNDRLAYLYERI